MTAEMDIVARVDEEASIAFLAEMIRHRSYSETEGEQRLAGFMCQAILHDSLQSQCDFQ